MALPEVTLHIESVRSNSPISAGAAFPITRRTLIVGRAVDCEIQLLDPSISRLHLRIDLEDDRIALSSLSRRSITIVDGRKIEAGQRFETRYRPFSIILGSVELRLEVSFETEEPGWVAFAAELTREEFLQGKETLDVPGLTTPPLDYRSDTRVVASDFDDVDTDEQEPFLKVVEGRAAAAVSVRGNWLELPRMTALALAALAQSAGRPVPEEVIERASGSESMVTKHVSVIRSVIRELLERGELSRDDITAQIASFPGFDENDLRLLTLEELMRKFVLSRRGFGYILHVRPEDVVVEEGK